MKKIVEKYVLIIIMSIIFLIIIVGFLLKRKNTNDLITKSFSEDSWETIIKAVETGNTSNYHVGDTKKIELGEYGTHTLRIANMSTPEECNTDGFSRTACGFIVEFADIIIDGNMSSVGEYNENYYEYGYNIGGWPNTLICDFLNDSDNEKSIISLMPSDIKKYLIDNKTYVLSSHGSADEKNFVSYDSLYLLSPVEVWGNVKSDRFDSTDMEYSRQLDYYKNNNAIKKYDGHNRYWYLRSADTLYDNYFIGVDDTGNAVINTADTSIGISPAFKIG